MESPAETAGDDSGSTGTALADADRLCDPAGYGLQLWRADHDHDPDQYYRRAHHTSLFRRLAAPERRQRRGCQNDSSPGYGGGVLHDPADGLTDYRVANGNRHADGGGCRADAGSPSKLERLAGAQ